MVVALPWILAIITYTIPEAPGIHHGGSINIFQVYFLSIYCFAKIMNQNCSFSKSTLFLQGFASWARDRPLTNLLCRQRLL